MFSNKAMQGSDVSNATKVRDLLYHDHDQGSDFLLSSGKPECLRCTSTGRKCDGYLPPKTWLFELRSEREASPGPSRPNPTFSSLKNLEESQALQFYREKTAPTLANYCSPHFWKVVVPSVAQSHPSITHITIAITELHRLIEELTDQPGPTRLHFMQHYSEAVSLITKRPASLATEIVLVCCLLFATCENFQGDPMTGLLHGEGGLKIFKEWKASAPQRLADSQAHRSDLIEREIAPVMERFEPMVSAYRNIPPGQRQASPSPNRGEGNPATESPAQPSIPRAYETLCIARQHLNEIIQWIHGALNWDSLATTSIVVERAESTREAKALLSQWLTAFDVYQPQIGGMHEKESLHRDCLHLRAHYRAALIMVECFLSTSEMSFDEQMHNFHALLEDCGAAAIPPTSPNITFHFGFSLGLISPLFLLATRCRHPTIRKEAVAVLRSMHRSEGCWDSCSAALIAEHVIKIEERGLTVIQSASDVTAFSRLRLVGAEVDYDNQQLVLRVARYLFNGSEAAIEEERMDWPSVVGQDRDIVEWVSHLRRTDPQFENRFADLTSTTSALLSPADYFASQPLDKTLGMAGYQGLILPERGICRHTASMRMGGRNVASTAGEMWF
jgi:hypothetical protein